MSTPATAQAGLPPGHPPIPPEPVRPAGEPGDPALRLRDGKTGAPLSAEALRTRIQAARVVYVGEHHDSAASHRAQLAVMELAYAVEPQLAVGLEMLPQALQPQLDAYLVGSVDEAGFLRAVDWAKVWGFDFALYRPLFEFCRAHSVRLYALNAPRNLARAVRQKGVPALSEAERIGLPDGYPWPMPEPHQKMLREIWNAHAKPAGGPVATAPDAEREAAFLRFYTAQLVWDEAMAEAVARLTAAGSKRGEPAPRLIVLAGVGHVGRHAVPERAARRGVTSALTLGPVEGDAAPPDGAEAVDVVYRIDPAPKEHGAP